MRNPNKSEVAFRPDVSAQGENPTEGQWESATRFRHVAESLDVTGLVRESVADMRSQDTIFGLNRNVKGLANPEFPFSTYVTGHGQIVTDTNAANKTVLASILENGLGGVHITKTTTAATAGSHTTTAVEVSDSDTYVQGALITIMQGGVGHVREITDVTGDVVTFDEALPAAPDDDDVIASTITVFVDEAVLENSDDAGGDGPHTWAYFVRKGGPGSKARWETLGCKTQVNTINLPRGDNPTVDCTVMCSSLVEPHEADDPTWSTTPEGLAPMVVGTRNDVWLQDEGETDANSVCVHEFSVELGVPQIRSETVTEAHEGMEGTCAFGTGPGDTMLTFSVVPFSDDFWAEWNADTDKVVRWAKKAQQGKIFAIHAPHCEVVESPAFASNEAHMATQLQLRAHPRESGSATALWRSKIKIGLA